MKNLILAIRACKKENAQFFLSTQSNKEHANLACVLNWLEQYSRGHIKQLDQISSFTTSSLSTMAEFTAADRKRAWETRSKLRYLLKALALTRSELPEEPLFQAIWSANCESPLFREIAFDALNDCLGDYYRSFSKVFYYKSGKFEQDGDLIKIETIFESRDRLMQSHRKWVFQTTSINSLDDYWSFRRDLLRAIPKPLEVERFPEFSDNSREQVRISKYQRLLKYELDRLASDERDWIRDNWARLNPFKRLV